jgi:hypothetical protein
VKFAIRQKDSKEFFAVLEIAIKRRSSVERIEATLWYEIDDEESPYGFEYTILGANRSSRDHAMWRMPQEWKTFDKRYEEYFAILGNK